jgi:hypothetical protein
VEEDIDVSGYSRGLDRPGLQRVLSRLAEFDVIVFFKIDRMARSTVDFAEIMKITQGASVALASASEPLDLTSSMGRAMAKVIAVFAELESDTIGMRVSSTHEHLRREGDTRAAGCRTATGSSRTPTARARCWRSIPRRPRRSTESWNASSTGTPSWKSLWISPRPTNRRPATPHVRQPASEAPRLRRDCPDDNVQPTLHRRPSPGLSSA